MRGFGFFLLIVLTAGCGGGSPAAGLADPAGEPSEAAAGVALAGQAGWGRILERHARDGGLDYAALLADRADLDSYVDSLEDADPAASDRLAQMAFWINAYNAVVARFVIDRYPDLQSVRDVDGFFDGLSIAVAGEELTLDEIEARALELGDPRVHFAVVCASASCPDLRAEPFSATRLDAQLAEQTRLFLDDESKGARHDRDRNIMWLSSIFKWYADDFTGGSRVVAFFARGRVLDWVLDHLPKEQAESIREAEPSVRYLDYDWSLNDRPQG